MSQVLPVHPQVQVSSSYYDPTADDGVTAFSKYNVHLHNPVVTPDFLAYNINIGDIVYLYNQDGQEVIFGNEPPTVDYITSKELRVGSSATESITNGFLYYKDQRGTPGANIIPGVSITANSQVFSFAKTQETIDVQQLNVEGRSGFITPSISSSLLKQTLSCLLITKSPRVIYPVIPMLGFNGWLLSASFRFEDSVSPFSIQYNTPANSTYIRISPTISPVYDNTTKQYTLMFENESISSYSLTEYPEWRAKKPLPTDSTVYIIFDTQPTAGAQLHMSFVFSKVIY